MDGTSTEELILGYEAGGTLTEGAFTDATLDGFPGRFRFPRSQSSGLPVQIRFQRHGEGTRGTWPSPLTFDDEFEHLADEWARDTLYESRIDRMVLHPAYQQIIGMGKAAVPLILQRLSAKPDHWFPALQAITGENPVPPDDMGNIGAMSKQWLRWGRQRGIIQ